MHLRYRKDIDGLRAIAVLSVVIYHFLPGAIPGGFAGVDIFFVISGFLITSGIHADLKNDRFSFKNFYRKRVRRILPAFSVATLLTLALGTLLLFPADLTSLAESAAAAVTFISNHYFANRFDYFSHNTWEFPLVHTWSLCIEEQFYFIWPALIWLAFKLRLQNHRLKYLILLGFGMSFVLSEYLLTQTHWIKAAYYLMATRADELLSGCFLGVCANNSVSEISLNLGLEKYVTEFKTKLGFKNSILLTSARPSPLIIDRSARHREILASIGLAVVLLSAVLLNGSSRYPGINSLFPTLGAVALIYAGPQTRVAIFLSHRWFVFIGMISYSLYLWHWPLLAFARYYFVAKDLPAPALAFLVLLVPIISYLSWKYIEQPFRKSEKSLGALILQWWVAPTAAVFAALLLLNQSGGWPSRFKEAGLMDRDTKFLSEQFCFERYLGDCQIGDRSKPQAQARAILFGDSNAGHYMPFWDELGRKLGLPIDAVSIDRCYSLIDINEHQPSKNQTLASEKCSGMIEHITSKISTYDVFIFASAWSAYLDDQAKPNFRADFRASLEHLQKLGKKIIVMEQAPVFEQTRYDQYLRSRYLLIPGFLAKQSAVGLTEAKLPQVTKANSDIESLIAEVLLKKPQNISKIYLLKPITMLGDKSTAALPFSNGDLLYRDGGHLNEFGSRLLATQLFDKLSLTIAAIFEH
jgi:peptidoglycan/LPS O-acetylase OafA/YrhL